MTLRIKLSHLVTGLVAGALLVGAGYALAATRNTVIHACVNTKTRALTVPAKGRCTRGSRALSWNQRGPRGATGRRGATGKTGASGKSATVSVGSVTTESPGSAASVSNSGSGSNAVLNFGIPEGATGASGPGTGATAYGQVWMWSGLQAASLARGSNNVTVSGGDGSAVVDVSGCAAAGLEEPVITVSADHDPGDTNSGNNNNVSGTAAAYVTGWSASGPTLEFDVSTVDPIHGTGANSDFSFTVYC